MGNSASADIFFGVVIYDTDGENPEIPWLDEYGEGEFDVYVVGRLSEIEKPDDEYPSRGDNSPEAESIKAKYVSYWAAKREFMEGIPIEEDHIGYMDGYSRRILKLKGWGARSGYDPKPIQSESLVVTEHHRKAFSDAMVMLGLEHLPQPQIHLAASYG